jgi:hypothetical protein
MALSYGRRPAMNRQLLQGKMRKLVVFLPLFQTLLLPFQ